MSTPDPNPSAASMTQSNTTVKTPSSSLPSYRPIASLHRQPQQSVPPHPFPVRRSNPVDGSPHQPHQDHHPSPLVYPTRPGRQSPSTVAGSPGGYPPLPVYAYQNGQGLDRTAAESQIQPASHLGSGHMKGVPHFLQPRVAHPPSTSILGNGGRSSKNVRSRNDGVLVLIRKRKVRITEGASLYSLCRSWLRNGAHEGRQKQQSDTTVTYLPKPLPASDVVETTLPKELIRVQDKEDEESVKHLSHSHLLKRHVDRAKKVRSRLREKRLKRIVRYKARLALLLPPFGE